MNEKVVHCKKDKYDVYVGRPTFWGNPWTHKDNTTADFNVCSSGDAVQCFKDWLYGTKFTDILQDKRQKIIDNIHTLQNKTIACWCSPESCHRDILLEFLSTHTVTEK